MLVLWGWRSGDVQAGSVEDRQREWITMADIDRALHAIMVEDRQRKLFAAMPTAADASHSMRRLGDFLSRY